jgi:Double sensory domain of two-component sensor kinase
MSTCAMIRIAPRVPPPAAIDISLDYRPIGDGMPPMGITIRLRRPRSSRGRRAAVVVGLLVVIAAIALAVSGLARARTAASEELRLAGSRLVRGLEARHRQLVEAARALAGDATLKRVAATGDQETARAILADHRQRMGADLLVLVSPKGTVASDSLRPARLGASFPLSPLLDEAERAGEASRIVVMDGGGTIRLGGAAQMVYAEELSNDLLVVLQRPLADALRPHSGLFLLLAVLGGAGLLLAIAAAFLEIQI